MPRLNAAFYIKGPPSLVVDGFSEILPQKLLLRDKHSSEQPSSTSHFFVLVANPLPTPGQDTDFTRNPQSLSNHSPPGLTLPPSVHIPALSHSLSHSILIATLRESKAGTILPILQMSKLRPQKIMRLSQRSHSRCQSVTRFQILFILLPYTTPAFQEISRKLGPEAPTSFPQQIHRHPLVSRGVRFSLEIIEWGIMI